MGNKKFYTGKYDRVFKTVICDEDDKRMFQTFLSRTLKKNVEIVEFLRNELSIQNVLEKVKTVDVLAKVDNEYIHIEVNTNYNNYLHVRNFTYFSSLYSKKVLRGEEYDYRTKFLHIDFTYGLGNSKDECIKYYIQSDDKERYLDNIEIIEFNMDKIMGYWYNQDKEKVNEYKHLIMLDLKTSDLKRLSKGDDFIMEFEEKITALNEDETFQSLMTYEQDQKFILNTEKRISFEEGAEQKKKEIAKSMLEKDMDIETISEITNLTIEEIEKLK